MNSSARAQIIDHNGRPDIPIVLWTALDRPVHEDANTAYCGGESTGGAQHAESQKSSPQPGASGLPDRASQRQRLSVQNRHRGKAQSHKGYGGAAQAG
jgi:hypothetical protein